MKKTTAIIKGVWVEHQCPVDVDGMHPNLLLVREVVYCLNCEQRFAFPQPRPLEKIEEPEIKATRVKYGQFAISHPCPNDVEAKDAKITVFPSGLIKCGHCGVEARVAFEEDKVDVISGDVKVTETKKVDHMVINEKPERRMNRW